MRTRGGITYNSHFGYSASRRVRSLIRIHINNPICNLLTSYTRERKRYTMGELVAGYLGRESTNFERNSLRACIINTCAASNRGTCICKRRKFTLPSKRRTRERITCSWSRSLCSLRYILPSIIGPARKLITVTCSTFPSPEIPRGCHPRLHKELFKATPVYIRRYL